MSTAVAELPDLYEVVNGQVVEKTVSVDANAMAADLISFINEYSRPKRLGKAYTEILIAMPDRFEHNRRPDAIYVQHATWPVNRRRPSDQAWDIVPEICIEVVSPTDSSNEIWAKVVEYFDAGVKEVWVIHPTIDHVEVFTSIKSSRHYDRSDTLRGDPVIPGFELPLAELFLPA
jgi:Uma2 family endonuclease